MIKLNIDAQKLAYIAKFASKEPSRYYLQSVYFTPEREIVATDGHRMGVLKNAFTIEAGELKEGQLVYIQRGHINELKKFKKTLVTVEIRDSDLVDIYKDGEALRVETQLINGAYPQSWRKIADDAINDAKRSEGLKYIALNPSYFESFAFDNKDQLKIELGSTSEKAIVIRSYKLGDDFTGVLMPIAWKN